MKKGGGGEGLWKEEQEGRKSKRKGKNFTVRRRRRDVR